MKKLLAFLFILATPAFAIDKPIPCDGANCKLKFETRDGSNVKVSAGEVNGSGVWVFGGNDPLSASTRVGVKKSSNYSGGGTGDIQIFGTTTPQNRVELGLNESGGGYGVLNAVQTGSSGLPLRLNTNGGDIVVGADLTTGTIKFGASGALSYIKRYAVSVSGGTTAQFTLPGGFFGHIYARTDAGSNGGVYFFGGDGNCVPAFGPTTISGNGILNRISVCNFTISGYGAGAAATIIIIGGTS
jgi:hypothetical protein